MRRRRLNKIPTRRYVTGGEERGRAEVVRRKKERAKMKKLLLAAVAVASVLAMKW